MPDETEQLELEQDDQLTEEDPLEEEVGDDELVPEESEEVDDDTVEDDDEPADQDDGGETSDIDQKLSAFQEEMRNQMGEIGKAVGQLANTVQQNAQQGQQKTQVQDTYNVPAEIDDVTPQQAAQWIVKDAARRTHERVQGIEQFASTHIGLQAGLIQVLLEGHPQKDLIEQAIGTSLKNKTPFLDNLTQLRKETPEVQKLRKEVKQFRKSNRKRKSRASRSAQVTPLTKKKDIEHTTITDQMMADAKELGLL